MQISAITSSVGSFSQKLSKCKSLNKNTQPSFKSIYIDEQTNLGTVALEKDKPIFLPKDALLLNELASKYPHQDCFIRRGYSNFPRLEYREKPPVVERFRATLADTYRYEIQKNDIDYPCVPLILYEDDNLNRYIGMTSYISRNPSLPTTIEAGYELHKKLIQKKYEILDMIGRVEEGTFDIGNDTVMERAKKEIEPIEVAVQRYLLEDAFKALTDKASAQQIYASTIPKIQSRLAAKRKLDLTTSLADMPQIDYSKIKVKKVNICDEAVKNYPNMQENKARIKELKDYLLQRGLVLG